MPCNSVDTWIEFGAQHMTHSFHLLSQISNRGVCTAIFHDTLSVTLDSDVDVVYNSSVT